GGGAPPGGRAMSFAPGPPSHPDRKAAIPTRSSINEGHAAPGAKTSPAAAAPPQQSPSRAAYGIGKDTAPKSWEERIGPTGLAIFAVIACAIAWYVTYRFF